MWAESLNGAIILRLSDAERVRLASHLDTLTAVASLASVAFEANREVETLTSRKGAARGAVRIVRRA